MGILTASEIARQVKKGNIFIEDFDLKRLNPNSYNLRLDVESLRVARPEVEFDCAEDNTIHFKYVPAHEMDEKDYEASRVKLLRNQLYLASTVELTRTNKYVPLLVGRSSLARLGVSIHQTAGFGDIGFDGRWTLEITCTNDTWVYRDMEFAQIYFVKPTGKIKKTYRGKYQKAQTVQTSRLHWEF